MVLGGAARNRMLIKGGSSFNALVRALKQDVVTGAAPTTTANEKLMYEVDKVSTNSSCLFTLYFFVFCRSLGGQYQHTVTTGCTASVCLPN